MEILLEQSERLVAATSTEYKRYLYNSVKWDSRLIGIKGARGTGKTTLLLQWIKELDLSADKAAYFSLDDLYFTVNSLKDTVTQFSKNGKAVSITNSSILPGRPCPSSAAVIMLPATPPPIFKVTPAWDDDEVEHFEFGY